MGNYRKNRRVDPADIGAGRKALSGGVFRIIN
jgi:hypothetical protein